MKTEEINSTAEKAFELRAKLHEIPEKSGQEIKTKAALISFLSCVEGLEIIDCGKWFYAVHRENAETSIAFRADLDAVSGADGSPYHGCGHDGHMSVMAALAASTAGRKLGKNLFFLFQHAEETGEGARECLGLFDREKIDAIYGFHNCPGFPEGAVLIPEDTFACASLGLILSFQGSQSHAAYPENGRNPIFPMAEFFSHWDELTDKSQYKGLILATPVCFSAGSRSFGVAAGSGEICLTLRARYNEDLEKLKKSVISAAAQLADEAGVVLSTSEMDVFPATENSAELLVKVTDAAHRAGLSCITPEGPFRWSEDFGWYSSKTKSFMLGIGAGESSAGLHTPEYCWNNEVTRAALKLFSQIAEN